MPCGEVDGYYYFNDNAPLYEHLNYLHSRNWREDDGSEQPPYGELPGKQKWRNGRFPAQKPDAVILGSQEMIEGEEPCPTEEQTTVFGLSTKCWKNAPPILLENLIGIACGPGDEQGVDMPVIVQGVDGAPEYTAVTRLLLNETDGFSLSQPAANQCRVDLQSATGVQKGVVDIVDQTFAGKKTFGSSIVVARALNDFQLELDRGGGIVGLGVQSYVSGSFNVNNLWARSFSAVDGYTRFALGYLPDLNTGAGFIAELSSDYNSSAMSYFGVCDGDGNIYPGVTGSFGGVTVRGGLVTGGAFAVTWGAITGTPTTLAGYSIGDAQPLDADLTAIAALSGTNTIYYRSGAGTWSAVTIGTGLTFVGGTLANTVTGIADGDYGDIVVSGTGTVWTIESCSIAALTTLAGLATATLADADTFLIADASVSDQHRKITATALRAYMVPPGSVQQFAGSSVPSGWLACDGSAVSRSTYADLFGAIGITWGAGNGTTTFNVPDLRGRALIGVGTGTGLSARTLGGNGGTETHTLATSEIPSHNHGANVGGTAGAFSILYNNIGAGGVAYGTAGGAGPWQFTGVETATSNAGSGGSHNNMPPFANIYHIIKT